MIESTHARIRHALMSTAPTVPSDLSGSGGDEVLGMSLDDIIADQSRANFGGSSGVSHRKPRILVCAPSNAGVDEIVSRLLSMGLMDGEGYRYKPDIIRIGRAESIRKEVTEISLDTRVDHYIKDCTTEQLRRRIGDARKRLNEAERLIRAIEADVKHRKSLDGNFGSFCLCVGCAVCCVLCVVCCVARRFYSLPCCVGVCVVQIRRPFQVWL